MLELTVPTRDLSVLIIEDQEDVATTLKLVLEVAAGHRVTIAADGEAGITAALAELPDAVICDIALPKKNGIEVAKTLSVMLRRPLLIACTAFSDYVMTTRCKAAGFDHFFSKPADPRRILDILSEYGRSSGTKEPLGT